MFFLANSNFQNKLHSINVITGNYSLTSLTVSVWNPFLIYETICSIFSDAAKFYLSHELRQLARGTKSDVSCKQTWLMPRNGKLRMTFRVPSCNVIVRIRSMIFPVIVKSKKIMCHPSPMQTEKYQLSGLRIVVETSFTALSVDPRAGLCLWTSETEDRSLFFLLDIKIEIRKNRF